MGLKSRRSGQRRRGEERCADECTVCKGRGAEGEGGHIAESRPDFLSVQSADKFLFVALHSCHSRLSYPIVF